MPNTLYDPPENITEMYFPNSRNSNNSQTQQTQIPTRDESEEAQKIRAWLYKSEFDENGRVTHCNAYSATPMKQANKDDDTDTPYAPNNVSSVHNNNPSNSGNKKDLVEGLNELKSVIGLDEVKLFIHDMIDYIEMNEERKEIGQTTKPQTLHSIFKGPPGTGKTTMARIMGKIMRGLGVLEKGHFIEVAREDLVVDHVGGTAKKTKEVLQKALGGILFIDEVYSLNRGGSNDFGKEAIDTIVKFMEDNSNKLIVIIAGYTKETDEFLKANSGLKSRFPNVIEFPDYTPEQLLLIAKDMIKKNDFKVDAEACKGLLEVLRNKQVPGRGDTGNGRLVRNLIEEAIRKQSKRLKAMPNKTRNDYFELIAEDFGYVKEKVFDLEKELEEIIGNDEIKDFIRNLYADVQIREQRRAFGLPVNEQSLHTILKGNPGTGKTTIARIMGRMLKELGVIKSGHVVEVTREDLVGGYVGHTAGKTKEKVLEALGGVLFIDEVYSLDRGGENDFGKEAIDTLVKQMEEHYENLVVIIAGYEHETNKFLKTNSGLKSRFPNVFTMKDYTAPEMARIAIKLANKQGYAIPKESYMNLLIELNKGVGKRDEGNGRFARNVVSKAILNQSKRLQARIGMLEKKDLILLTAEDFIF